MTGRAGAERSIALLHRLGTARQSGRRASRPWGWAAWAGFLTLLVWTHPAVAGHRVQAVARLWTWQAWRRIVRRPVEVRVPAGWRLLFPSWSTLAGVTVATGLHEPSEQLFVVAYLRPDDGVIDVGANVGIYAVACAALGGRVLAFEPSTAARLALLDNTRLNDVADRVRIYEVAVGDCNGRLPMTTSLDAQNHLVHQDHGAGGEGQEIVEVRTLDSLRTEMDDWLASRPVALLKIDAEGHDLQVLHGATTLIGSHRPVILVETWPGDTAVRAFLASAGYRVHRYDIERHRLIEYADDWSGQCNFIAIPDERLRDVEARLAERPPAPLTPPDVRWLQPRRDGAPVGRAAAVGPRRL